MQKLIAQLSSKLNELFPAFVPPPTDPTLPKCKRRLPGEPVDDMMFSPGFIHQAGDGTLRDSDGGEVMPGAKVYVVGRYAARSPRTGYYEAYENLEVDYVGFRIPAYRRAGLDSGYPLTQDLQRKVYCERNGGNKS